MVIFMYPLIRLRRNRRTKWLRDLVAETHLLPSHLILPVFVVEGENQKQEISSMPGVHRQSIDQVIMTAKKAEILGIKAIALFPSIDNELKTDDAAEAYNLDNLVCRTIRALRNEGINIGIICDVALDPYTSHGHDGIVIDGEVANDETVKALCNQAIVLAKAGADIVAPSDMMDGRIVAIREELDNDGFSHVNILAYAAKYASSFYAPFRTALNNGLKQGLDKASYQMDVRNVKEAVREIELDLNEGADFVMIKPAMPCLDVIKEASNSFNSSIFAFQVSGEYSMLKFAALAGALDWQLSLLESLTSIKRAGATGIFTYAALEAAELLQFRSM